MAVAVAFAVAVAVAVAVAIAVAVAVVVAMAVAVAVALCIIFQNNLTYLPVTLHYFMADYTLIPVSAAVAVATVPITIGGNSALYYGMT